MQPHPIVHPSPTQDAGVVSHRRDHTGMPIDAVVAVTEVNLSFGTIFRLALVFAIAQAIIGAIILVVLFALAVI